MAKSPDRSRASSRRPAKGPSAAERTFWVVGWIGISLLTAAAVFFALTPAAGPDSRPRLIAALVEATSTAVPTHTPTSTPSPTASQVPTETPTATVPSTETPIPTITNTPFPPPTPDSLDRAVAVPILMYHYVSVPPADADIYRLDLSVTPDKFHEQMQWLKDNGYTVIDMYYLVQSLARGRPQIPERSVILTFDDGYRDNYENAFPVLRELGFTGTFFILTDVTDREDPNYMTWDMLREMVAADMDIEVHGREHTSYAGRDPDWLFFFLQGPVETIQAELGYQPRMLAYISGEYDDLTMQSAHDLGYWAAVTTQYGILHEKDRMLELKRIRIKGEWDITTFSAVIEGLQN